MSGCETVKIQYLPGSPHLVKTDKGSWIDLYVYEDVEIPKGTMKLVNLGVAMQLPQGYEAHLVPRSSTFKRYGIIQANSVGIIDCLFNGPSDVWHFPAYATRDVLIPKGSRICQFRIVEEQPEIVFDEVVRLGNSNRNGFGSTGV